ncbi:hypothetical protein [Sphingobacterium multivorum]
MKQPISKLKEWFGPFKMPSASNFGDLIDSFFHKDGKIPAQNVEGWTDDSAVELEGNVLPQLADKNKYVEVYGGANGRTLTYLNTPIYIQANHKAILFWSAAEQIWKLQDEIAIPENPTKTKNWQVGSYEKDITAVRSGIPYRAIVEFTSEEPRTGADWEAIVPSKRLVENFIGVNNLLRNSSFESGLRSWVKNDEAGGTIVMDNGQMVVKNTGMVNFALTQQQIQAFSVDDIVHFSAKVKKKSIGDVVVQVNLYNVSDQKYFNLVGEDWTVIRGTLKIHTSAISSFALAIQDVGGEVVVDNIAVYTLVENSIEKNASEGFKKANESIVQIGYSELLPNNNFKSGLFGWYKNEEVFDLDLSAGYLHATTHASSNVGILRNGVKVDGPGRYAVEVNVKRISASDFSFSLGTYSPTYIQSLVISDSMDWQLLRTTIELTAGDIKSDGTVDFMIQLTSNVEILVESVRFYKVQASSLIDRLNGLEYKSPQASWMPAKSSIISAFLAQLKPFFDKHIEQDNDVTVVQIGDSISTDLNWTKKRDDAKERPPFCDEYNVNSFLEEKLRWREQKYRRHDYAGVFAEIKGGGNSLVKSVDSNWGFVGDAYYLPSTRVIDSGTNAGVAFDTIAMTQRVSLIVHTDKAWANSTQITISAGNGKALVKNNAGNWVEANGYTLSLKEEDTISTLGFNKDNAQKRLDFKIITNVSTPTTITVKNIGVGRFAYWGIEYSPKEFLFRYICASKGSHTIADLERYESWMVDSFNPDLVLWQCPILNEGIGQEFRSYNTAAFVKRFTDKLARLHTKNYLVFPYILWGAVYSKFISNMGEFLYGFSTDNNKEYTAFQEAAKLNSALSNANNGLSLNLFDRITEVGLEKSKIEGRNIFKAALLGSGKDGNSFTIDSIHLNRTGNEVVWRMLETYFNF